MLKQAFGDNSLGQTQTYGWHKRFKNSQTSTDDDERLGRPSTGTTPENIAKVRDMILQELCGSPFCKAVSVPVLSLPIHLPKSPTVHHPRPIHFIYNQFSCTTK
jgi:hypothetical protein